MVLVVMWSRVFLLEAATLTPQEGVYNMVSRPLPKSGEKIDPVELRITGNGTVKVQAVDIDEKPLSWSQTLKLEADKPQTLQFPPPSLGYYRLSVTENGKEVGFAELGIIPKQHPGVRRDSFFASNVWVPDGDRLKLLQALGMRIQRNHFQGHDADDLRWFTRVAAQLENLKAHDVWFLPLAGYAFPGRKSEWAEKLRMHGPPEDFEYFVQAWEKILTAFPELNTVEFWNEPWIFGWTWAATPEEYRELQTMWCKMARRVRPDLRILAGNSSMFTEDHIEHYPECWKGFLDGTTHHPYHGASYENQRLGSHLRTIDMGNIVTRRMELPYYYLTEGGVEYLSPVKGGSLDKDGKPAMTHNNRENGRNLVAYFVRSALCSVYQGNAQWDIGYGPTWTIPNTAFAFMTYMLEDRPTVVDIWPHHELIYGVLYANAKHVTDDVRALPRASELSVRWNISVPEDRKDDPTKVAIVWSHTGMSNENVDKNGTLSMEAKGLKAYDVWGREIPARAGTLVVPFTLDPVYIVSDTLTVMELKDRIGNAGIAEVTPLNMYAFSLMQPADRSQTLGVRMQNQLNVDLSGTLTVQVPGTDMVSKVPFAVPAGKLKEIAVPWTGAPVVQENQYGINLSAQIDGKGKPVMVSQIIATAQFAKRTIPMTGSVEGWKGVTPVSVLPKDVAKQIDLTPYYLNPHLARPEDLTLPQPEGLVKIYAAYDADYVYIALDGLGSNNTAGKLVWENMVSSTGARLLYEKGRQDGLNHVVLCGDHAQLSFGFRDRVPGYGRQMDDPFAWKGQFYDTDYLYMAHSSTTGDTFVREWGADTTRQTSYQTVALPGRGKVEGAKFKITGTFYEIAIPRSELKLFDPATMDRFRFSVNMNNNALSWSETAGVFDHWWGTSSFGPSWGSSLANQTFWGIEK